jgi:hypothetical protein
MDENVTALNGAAANTMSLGQGEVSRSDMDYVEKALRKQWPIEPEIRALVIMQAEKIICNPDMSDRWRILAMKVLLAADALNIRREALAMRSTESPRSVTIVNQIESFTGIFGGQANEKPQEVIDVKPAAAPAESPPAGEAQGELFT